MQNVKKWIAPALALIFLVIALSQVMKLHSSQGWIIFFSALAIFFALLTYLVKNKILKYSCLCLMSVMLVFIVAERYLVSKDSSPSLPQFKAAGIEILRKEHNNPNLFFYQHNWNTDTELGFAPLPEAIQTVSRRVDDGEVIYDVVYSSLPSGWRVTPQHPEAETAVIFFGCSFTFGEGLNDADSFPYKVAEQLGEKFQVFNFAFHGYGSNQMLVQIESGILDDIAKKYKKLYVFYTTIDGHGLRSAALPVYMWAPRFPWYELENGQVVRKGDISDKKFAYFLYENFKDYHIYQQLFLRPSYSNSELERFRELHTSIMKQADRELFARYGIHLVTAIYPTASFGESISKKDLLTLDLNPYFPDLKSKPDKYWIHKKDQHPNALATDCMAKAIVEYVKNNELLSQN